MHLIIREDSRVQGRVWSKQNNTGPGEISHCTEKLKEFPMESQTWGEKDRAEEGGTT